MPPSHRLRTGMPLVAALAAKTEGFTTGVNTNIDVQDAKRDWASARYDYLLNLPRLKQAAGTLSGIDLARINAWLP
jgi:outer membrane protein